MTGWYMLSTLPDPQEVLGKEEPLPWPAWLVGGSVVLCTEGSRA